MFSLLSCESGLLELCSSMSCESRNAHAIPAGPPPTMTTSAGICGWLIFSGCLRKINIGGLNASRFHFQGKPALKSLTLRLLHFFSKNRDNIEQIPDHGYIRNFKDRGFVVFINGDH